MTLHPRRLGSVFLVALLLLGCASGSETTERSGKQPMDTENPVVATFDDSTITLSQFEQAYRNANTGPTPASDSLHAYKDFLDQYVNFHLKIRAAREAGLDTVSSVTNDIRSYREEIARPRLMRSEVYEPLVRELYERRKEEVDVSHILIRVSPEAAPEDTTQAYKTIRAIKDSLRRGIPFGDLAVRNSEDPSAQKQGQPGFRGRLGYVRAGQIVKSFEDRMYRVPPDSTSEIFRTRFGYHILKVHDRRPAQQPFRLSHIMLRPTADSGTARQFLDSLRTEIVQNGTSFDSLARKHSEDRPSAVNGGDLGKVDSPQSLPPAFRRAVAGLDTVGAVSGVVKSQYGFHLLQLTDRETAKDFETAYKDLRKQIADRPRVDRQKERFARDVHSKVGLSVDTSRILRRAKISSLDTLARPLLSLAEDTSATATAVPVATLGDSTFTLGQLARHVMQTDGGARLTVGQVLDDLLTEKALRYAHVQLAQNDSTLSARMEEYRDGLLAFQFMQDSVWTAAAQDTAGLRQLYKQQRNTYRFPERVRTITFRADADSVLDPYLPRSSNTRPSVLVRNATDDSLVTVDTVMVTQDSPEIYHRVFSLEDGAAAGPLNQDGGRLLLIRDTVLLPRTKTFEEARPQVVQDYQDRYEEKVLSRLRRRYNVETYPDRLRHAFSDTEPNRKARN